jgi:hypothetical protein
LKTRFASTEIWLLWFLPGIAFSFQNFIELSLAAPLFTGRFSLPVLKGGNPICLNRVLASGTLLGIVVKF